MKKMIIVATIAIIIGLTGCTAEEIEIPVVEEMEVVVEQVATDTNIELESLNNDEILDWGSGSALSQETFTIEEMLVYAIQDEYTAKSEYIMIMDKFDITKPFSNIYKSEETHISLLLPLFETYEYIVPFDDSENHLFEINSVDEAFDIGVVAEINNIAMYNLFLEQELPEDVETVFIQLRDASINHLSAFEKNAAK